MTDISDIDALAAEYVLGTLDAGERATVAARLQREPALAEAVAAWQRRLAPLDALAPAMPPPAGLFDRIEQRLADPGRQGGSGVASTEIVDLRHKLRIWRLTAIAALAGAACLLVALGLREWSRTDVPRNYVAVFQKDDASPSFVMTVDLATRTLSIRRVSAEVPPGKTYQLWIVSDKLAPGPHSLGLIEDHNGELQKALDMFDPSLVQNALFGVSLEPAGGSPIGTPTGPAFHTHLIPTSN